MNIVQRLITLAVLLASASGGYVIACGGGSAIWKETITTCWLNWNCFWYSTEGWFCQTEHCDYNGCRSTYSQCESEEDCGFILFSNCGESTDCQFAENNEGVAAKGVAAKEGK